MPRTVGRYIFSLLILLLFRGEIHLFFYLFPFYLETTNSLNPMAMFILLFAGPLVVISLGAILCQQSFTLIYFIFFGNGKSRSLWVHCQKISQAFQGKKLEGLPFLVLEVRPLFKSVDFRYLSREFFDEPKGNTLAKLSEDLFVEAEQISDEDFFANQKWSLLNDFRMSLSQLISLVFAAVVWSLYGLGVIGGLSFLQVLILSAFVLVIEQISHKSFVGFFLKRTRHFQAKIEKVSQKTTGGAKVVNIKFQSSKK